MLPSGVHSALRSLGRCVLQGRSPDGWDTERPTLRAADPPSAVGEAARKSPAVAASGEGSVPGTAGG